MTSKDKQQFIRTFLDSMQKTLLDKVQYMPEDWDGHELRRYIADQFECECTLMRRGYVRSRGQTMRLRRYRNVVATISNL